jgi:transcriptional regulator with XRE-family HTH domain
MSIIGDTIKQRRLEKGLSMAELARRADISKGHLHSIESGETESPSAEMLFRIANELGTTIADLLGKEDPTSAPKRLRASELPQELLDFAKEEGLPDTDIQMLASIEYRGKKPKSVDDWRFIYESIKRTLR